MSNSNQQKDNNLNYKSQMINSNRGIKVNYNQSVLTPNMNTMKYSQAIMPNQLNMKNGLQSIIEGVPNSSLIPPIDYSKDNIHISLKKSIREEAKEDTNDGDTLLMKYELGNIAQERPNSSLIPSIGNLNDNIHISQNKSIKQDLVKESNYVPNDDNELNDNDNDNDPEKKESTFNLFKEAKPNIDSYINSTHKEDTEIKRLKNLQNPFDSVDAQSDHNSIIIQINNDIIGNYEGSNKQIAIRGYDTPFPIDTPKKTNREDNSNEHIEIKCLELDRFNHQSSKAIITKSNPKPVKFYRNDRPFDKETPGGGAEKNIYSKPDEDDIIIESMRCRECNKVLEPNESIQLDCLCIYCINCLRVKMIRGTENKIILNQYEKVIAQRNNKHILQCKCLKEINTEKVISIVFPKEINSRISDANERLKKTMRTLCLICGKDAVNKRLICMEAMPHIICLDCYEVREKSKDSGIQCLFCNKMHIIPNEPKNSLSRNNKNCNTSNDNTHTKVQSIDSVNPIKTKKDRECCNTCCICY